MKPLIKTGQPILVKSKREFLLDPHGWTTEIFNGVKSGMIVTTLKYYNYAVPLNRFYPLDMERTARYIVRVKDGELIQAFPHKATNSNKSNEK